MNPEVARTDAEFAARGFLSPHELPDDLLAGRVAAVLIDVARMTTTVSAVLAAGARAVQVVGKTYDGRADDTPLRAGVPLVCGGERMGQPFPGALFGNSALEVPSAVRGKDVRFYSSNSGRAFEILSEQLAATSRATVFLATMFNIETVAAAIEAGAYDVVAVCAGGFYDRVSLEDAVAGGRLLHRLGRHGVDDGATTMLALAERFADDAELLAAVSDNRVGRTLRRFGREPDLAAAITGAGIPSHVIAAMRCTTGRLAWLDADTPVFVISTHHTHHIHEES